MNVVDLKNIVLLVTKKIWSSVNLECKIMSQVSKIMFKQIVAVLFDWRFSYSPFQYGCYIHAVIVLQWFSRSLPSEVLCIISGEYTRYCLPHLFCHNDSFTLQFYACVDDTFLVPNESVQHLLERRWEIIEENIYFYRLISGFISLVFLSASVALNILSLYQLSLHLFIGRTNIAVFQIMCFKTKMNVFYNTATLCLFVFLTSYDSCIEEFIGALLNGFRICWFFHCIEASGEVLNSISWLR